MMRSQLLVVPLVGLFFTPYLFLIWNIGDDVSWVSLFFQRAPYSALQAALSTIGTLLCSLIGAYGLGWIRQKTTTRFYALIEFILLIPSILPSLFLIVSTLKAIPHFPLNLFGVVFLHILNQVGLSSIFVRRILDLRLSGWAETMILFSERKFYFIFHMFPLIRRDLILLSSLFFVYFLTSFSIPMLVGGASYSSLEIIIFKLITVNNNWAVASGLICMQAFMVVGLLLMIEKFSSFPNSFRVFKRTQLMDSLVGIPILLIPFGVLCFGFLKSLPGALQSLSMQPDVFVNWKAYLLGSLLIGFLAAGLCFTSLSFLVLSSFNGACRRLLNSFLTPSYVAIAFGGLIVSKYLMMPSVVIISMAVSLSILPSLYRLGVMQKIEELQFQYEMGYLLSGSYWYTLSKVVYPQLVPQLAIASGIAGVWAVGDYSMSRVLSGSDITLAMWTQSLVQQYRWDIAVLTSLSVLFASCLVFLFFWSLSYVTSQKLM